MNYDFAKDKNSEFYEVTEKEIIELEEKLSLSLPLELKIFYKEIGYGFIDVTSFDINRIMDTFSIIDFRLRKGTYLNTDLSEYDGEYENNKLIFFERNESSFLSIELSDKENSRIYYNNIEIAKSLEQFLTKMKENDLYFFEIVKKELSKNQVAR